MNFSQLFCLRSMFVLFLVASMGWSVDASADTLRLKWTDVSDDESGFKIERMSASGNYVHIADVPANTQTYTDRGLTLGKTYCYKVWAFNATGTSIPSNVGCTTALTPSGSSNLSTADGSSLLPRQNPAATLKLNPNSLSAKWTDYRVTTTIRSPDNKPIGILFRYQDEDNYYRFSWADGSRRLEKRVAGAFKQLAQDTAAYKEQQTYAVQIVAQGSRLKILIDEKTIFSVTDTTFSAGTIALYPLYNAGSSFAGVRVEELRSGKLLLSDNLSNRGHVGWTIVEDGIDIAPSGGLAATGDFGQSSDTSGTYAVFTRGSWQDYRLTLKMRAAEDGPIGVLFRLQDTSNYYRWSWGGESAGRRLIKRQEGLDQVIAQDSVPHIPGKNYHVEIVAQGSSLKVSIDGKSVFSVTDQSFKIGTIGLHAYASKASVVDDVIVEELSSKALLVWDDFNNGEFIGWTISGQPGTSANTSPWSVVEGELVQSYNTVTLLLY